MALQSKPTSPPADADPKDSDLRVSQLAPPITPPTIAYDVLVLSAIVLAEAGKAYLRWREQQNQQERVEVITFDPRTTSAKAAIQQRFPQQRVGISDAARETLSRPAGRSTPDPASFEIIAQHFRTQEGRHYSREQIEALQRRVGANPDGTYGAETAERVYQWQHRHGVQADGEVGPITYQAMFGVPRPSRTQTSAEQEAVRRYEQAQQQRIQADQALEQARARVAQQEAAIAAAAAQELTQILQERMERHQDRWNQVWQSQLEGLSPPDRAAILAQAAADYQQAVSGAEVIDPQNPQPQNAGLFSDIFHTHLNTRRMEEQRIMVGEQLPPLGGYGEGPQPTLPDQTGHAPSEPLPPLPGMEGTPLEVPTHTGHAPSVVPGVSHTFTVSATRTESWTDYRANYAAAHGGVPADHQVHHLIPRQLGQKWSSHELVEAAQVQAGYNINRAANLITLPATGEAYKEADIQVLHSGSHPAWTEYVTEVLDDEQRALEKIYGSLEKVSAQITQQTMQRIEQRLNQDIQNSELGIEGGWINPNYQKDGATVNKLSLAEPSSTIVAEVSSTQPTAATMARQPSLQEQNIDQAPIHEPAQVSSVEWAMASNALWVANQWIQDQGMQSSDGQTVAVGQHYAAILGPDNTLSLHRQDGSPLVQANLETGEIAQQQPFTSEDTARFQVTAQKLMESQQQIAKDQGPELELG